jgi:predicted ester cyclase
MTLDNEALARSFFEEADRGRTPVELCAAGFTAHFPGPPPMDLAGFDQFEAMIRSAFSGIRHPIEDLMGDGDRVAVRLRFEGTHTGEFMGAPASGKQFSVQARRSCTLPVGRSPSCGGFFDQLGLMQQIGGLPAPAQAGSAANPG